MIILGIDPGTAITGYGIIEVKTKKVVVIDYGYIATSQELSNEVRLQKIYNALIKILNEYKPQVLAVEKLFFFKNAKTLIPVSQARGIVLLAGAKKKVPIYEFTPLQVKMNITGYGRAEKKEVQEKIKELLNLKEIPKPNDVADALGVALTCADFLKTT